ncbi:MAG TPA: Nramp family divalent metal transporter [Rectinemataceae bacterium]|nr:Nramp family divalent metal transporter [Rectinemataceae bacterium]
MQHKDHARAFTPEIEGEGSTFGGRRHRHRGGRGRRSLFRTGDHPRLGAIEIFRYIGPGLLVTIGFIDPGNWASNLAAGSTFGYSLIWVVSLGTIMLMLLQHNAAHLGIATGYCLSEAASIHLPRRVSVPILGSAVAAAISTALAEVLGAAIAINLLTGLPLRGAVVLAAAFTLFMLFSNSYRRLEKWIIGFVSLIGLSFVFELGLVKVDWGLAASSAFLPSFPKGSILVIMSLLGSVVMPHNLFLHSEIIQSRQWNLEDESKMRHQLRFEFTDTMFSMVVGWAINCAIIVLAAAAFHAAGTRVEALGDAKRLLEPLMGKAAGLVFAAALLFSGISSSITAGMAGGAIYTGVFGECYDLEDRHTKFGILLTIVGAAFIALFVRDPFWALVISQMVLSIQLPFTIFTQIALTSSRKVMGDFVNTRLTTAILFGCGLIVSALNVVLVVSAF